MRSLGIALCLTLSFMVVELVVGLWSGSLALLADAGHMLNDSGALTLSLIAIWIAGRERSRDHTYGYRRAEVVGAFISALALVGAATWISIEAVERLGTPREIHGPGMLLTAVLGLLVNVVAAWVLWRGGSEAMSVRAARLHVLGDALGSVAAIIAAGFVWMGWSTADPVASLVIAFLIAFGALRLIRDSGRVLMEGVPAGLVVADLERTIRETEGVEDVHDLHVWALVPEVPVLSAHVVLTAGADPCVVVRAIGDRVAEEHEVTHSTIQPERSPKE